MESKYPISRQVSRALERQTEKASRRHALRQARSDRKQNVVKTQRRRDADVGSGIRSMSIPLVNLIGKERICQGWFRRGDFR